MNAQQIINECDTQKLSREKFRAEMNVAWFLNDVVKQCKELGI